MSSYEQTRRRHVQSMLESLDEHMRRLRWSAEQLQQERDARLRQLVSVAKQRSAWHRRRLSEVDERTIDEQRLRELPVMRKEEMMEHFDQIVTDPRVTLAAADAHIASLSSDAYFAGELHVVASGGSSGVRGVFAWGWDAWAAVQLVLLRQQLTDRLADPELATRPVVGMVVAANNAAHFTSALAQTFATEAVQMHRFPIGLPIDEIVTSLNRVDGDGLATYPSMLATLLAEARAGRLQIHPQRIVTMAEPLPEDVREAAEEIWQAPVANMWGISEAGIAALGCFKGAGMHLADDLIIVEPVDADGRAVPAGVASDAVYVTNLLNTLQPIIRYEITDQVTFVEEPCPCGSEHRRIADIQGRRDDTFTYRDGAVVNPHIFRSALAREAGVCEYQVRQTETGAEILLRTIGPVDEPRLRTDLQDALREQGVLEPLIETRVVQELKRLDTGKLKRFVPRPPPR
jgi:putative adenylate-forming enzyme